MNKSLLLLVSAGMLFCTLSNVAAIKHTAKVIINTPITNISGDEIAQVIKGEEVIIKQWGENCQVKFGDVVGFVSSNVLGKTGVTEVLEKPIEGTINADETKLRMWPDSNATILSVLKKGTMLTVSEVVDGYFKATINMQTGFVPLDYCDTPQYTKDTYSTLKMGSSGAGVLKLQKVLCEKGYFASEVNGNYGALTRDAVKTFEEKHGLRVDGTAESDVQLLLFS